LRLQTTKKHNENEDKVIKRYQNHAVKAVDFNGIRPRVASATKHGQSIDKKEKTCGIQQEGKTY